MCLFPTNITPCPAFVAGDENIMNQVYILLPIPNYFLRTYGVNMYRIR